MFLSIMYALEHWLFQLYSLFQNRLHHLSPQDYCTMLVLCIAIGYFLLRSRS